MADFLFPQGHVCSLLRRALFPNGTEIIGGIHPRPPSAYSLQGDSTGFVTEIQRDPEIGMRNRIVECPAGARAMGQSANAESRERATPQSSSVGGGLQAGVLPLTHT